MNQSELFDLVDNVIKNYRGDVRLLESAIGALHVGLKIGWRPLRLIHSHQTFVRYEKILDLDFHEIMPEVGSLAHKSVGWRLAKKLANFWDAVRGPASYRSKEFS